MTSLLLFTPLPGAVTITTYLLKGHYKYWTPVPGPLVVISPSIRAHLCQFQKICRYLGLDGDSIEMYYNTKKDLLIMYTCIERKQLYRVLSLIYINGHTSSSLICIYMRTFSSEPIHSIAIATVHPIWQGN